MYAESLVSAESPQTIQLKQSQQLLIIAKTKGEIAEDYHLFDDTGAATGRAGLAFAECLVQHRKYHFIRIRLILPPKCETRRDQGDKCYKQHRISKHRQVDRRQNDNL
jgi:hypothetical protein